MRQTYGILKRTCRRLKLNPDIFGLYPFTDSVPISCFKSDFNFDDIPNFPISNLEQVLLIGQIIRNLISQKVHKGIWVVSCKKDMKDLEKNRIIDEIVILWTPIMKEWLDVGLKKVKSDKKLMICNGQVYEVNPIEVQKMQNFNNYMAGVRFDFHHKMNMSEVSK